MKKIIRYFTIRDRIKKAIRNQQNQISIHAQMQLESKRDNNMYSHDFWTEQRGHARDISKILKELL